MCRTSSAARQLAPVDFELAVAGRAQPAQRRRGARRARARRRRARRRRAGAAPRSAAPAAGSSCAARPAASRVFDDYAHHPAEIAADARRRARAGARPRARRSSSRTSTRARAISRRELGAALAARRRRRGRRRLRGARAAGGRRRPGKLVVDALGRARGRACAVAWTPALEDGVRFLAGARARPGDIVLTLGAGDVDRAAPLLLEALA